MSKQVTITLPDGYENATHLVVVAPGDSPNDYEVYGVVLDAQTSEAIEEIGGGTAAQILGKLAGRIVRTGTAARST